MPVRHLLRAVALLLVATAIAAFTAGAGTMSPGLRVGIVENAGALGGDPYRFYRLLGELRVDVLRINLNWGGPLGVARRRPENAADPRDEAYDWRRYDATVLRAARGGVDILFTIFGSPRWASGAQKPNRPPREASDLRAFAYAAALRYSGRFRRSDGVVLPAVRLWTAWNEPNLKLGLARQYGRVGSRYVVQSAADYARICNAVYEGVHRTGIPGERVACGVTAPRGNDRPRSKYASVSPLRFLRAMKQAGVRTFDAYAHHPYPGHPSEAPATPPRRRGSVSLGNIDQLVREVTRLYGRKPIWITEYGYQTNPPDPLLGVSWQRQARYLSEAFALARRHPRIQLMLWFLLDDERRVGRWQSGLITASGRRKPAFSAFRRAATSPASRVLPQQPRRAPR